ncbi:TRAP transporter small permease subunit [Chelativorans sp. Marseille-P2723]|uniref:TRAP transporter small permease n=1 Tax=Chelativorans sp. Marseille-P2723 TaxID=2709133 RepID=UPI0015712415|nr:TRAP transporter small permease subunit [Chelativorans sp. Marseille-P2723]
MIVDTMSAGHALPKGLAIFRQLLAGIGKAELVLAVASLITVVVLSAAQAFLRYFGGGSLWWAQEVAETTILISYFLGISYVFKTRQEIYIEFAAFLMPLGVQMLMFIFEQLVTLAFTLTLLWLAWLFAPTMLNMQTPLLKLPGWVPFFPLILSTAMIALTSIYYCLFGLWAFASVDRDESIREVEQHGLVLRPWEVQL